MFALSSSGKDPDCPNCGGRSFDASGGSDEYFECELCERPTEKFHAFYQLNWPATYERWASKDKA